MSSTRSTRSSTGRTSTKRSSKSNAANPESISSSGKETEGELIAITPTGTKRTSLRKTDQALEVNNDNETIKNQNNKKNLKRKNEQDVFAPHCNVSEEINENPTVKKSLQTTKKSFQEEINEAKLDDTNNEVKETTLKSRKSKSLAKTKTTQDSIINEEDETIKKSCQVETNETKLDDVNNEVKETTRESRKRNSLAKTKTNQDNINVEDKTIEKSCQNEIKLDDVNNEVKETTRKSRKSKSLAKTKTTQDSIINEDNMEESIGRKRSSRKISKPVRYDVSNQTDDELSDDSVGKKNIRGKTKRHQKEESDDISGEESFIESKPKRKSKVRSKIIDTKDNDVTTSKIKRSSRLSRKKYVQSDEDDNDVPSDQEKVEEEEPIEEEEEEIDDETENLDLNERVTCQICKEEMTQRKFIKTHKAFHNDLCWSNKEQPINFYDPIEVLLILNRIYTQVKKQLFICPLCKDAKKSPLGYYSHFLNCGRTPEEIEMAQKACDKCGKKIFLPFYSAHEIKHLKESFMAQSKAEESSKIKDTSFDDDNSSVQLTSKRSAARRAVSKIAKITGELIEGENNEQQNETKRKKKNREIDESEFVVSGDEQNIVSEEEEEESDEIEEFPTDDEDNDVNKDGNDEAREKGFQRIVRRFYSRMFDCTQDLYYGYKILKSLYSSEPIYKDLLVPEFKLLDQDHFQEYLPETKTSVSFKFDKGDSLRLNLFSSLLNKDNYTLFCGGPIWALSWLPEEMSIKKSSDQYLALATHKNMEKEHKRDVTEKYKSIIQIWKFPQMSCLGGSHSKPDQPKMIFGITHEEGAVWCLEWCPSGGNIPNTRLGLLAAAFSSGQILIYSVPYLDDISNGDHINISNLEPVRILQLDEFNATPCYRLAWKRTTPHDIIFAGYGDGTVAFFDITTTSELLLQKNEILFPINLFQAHFGEVTVLSLPLSKDSNLLYTTGLDRYQKVWDISDLNGPIQNFVQVTNLQKKPICGGFFPYLPIFTAGFDTCIGKETSTFYPVTIRDFGYNTKSTFRSLLAQNGAHFSANFSHFFNTIATGNELGTLYLLQYKNNFNTRKVDKHVQLIAFHTKYIETENNVNVKTVSSNYEYVASKYQLQFSLNKTGYTKEPSLISGEYDLANFISVEWNNNLNNMSYVAAGQKCGLLHVFNTKIAGTSHIEYLFTRIQNQSV